MTFSKLFGSLDLFKQPLFLRVSRQEKSSTNFGIFISVLIYIFLTYSFFQNDYFKKLNPLISSQTTTSYHRPYIQYQDKPLAFSITDLNGKIYLDPSFFTFVVYASSGIMSPSGDLEFDYTEKTFHVCNESDADNTQDWLFLKGNYCLDQSSFDLEGGIGEDIMKNLQIHLYSCQNQTNSNVICRSPEEIDAFFDLKNLNLIYMNTFFQAKDYEQPTINKLSSQLYKLDSQLSSLVTINFQQAQLITDETQFFSSENNILDTLAYDQEKLEYGRLTNISSPVASVIFYSSDNILIMSRTYQKLSEAIAVLGGLLSFFTVCGRIISSVDKSLFMTTLLMNFLYSFQQPNNPYSDKSPPKNSPRAFSFHSVKKTQRFNEKTLNECIQNVVNNNDKNINDNNINDNNVIDNNINDNNINDNKSNMLQLIKPDITNNLRTSHEILITPENTKCTKLHIELEKLQEKILGEDSFIEENSPKRHSAPISCRKQPNIWDSARNKILKTSKLMMIFGRTRFFGPQNSDKGKSVDEFLKFRDQKNNLVFTNFDYIKYCMKKMFRIAINLKEKLFIRARETFENEIDIVKILQRIQDIEKLKYLLLDENQMALFNILEKPMIYVDENRNPNRTSFSLVFGPKKISSKVQVEKAFEYYKELEKEKEMDPIDLKLFHLVDKRFKTFQKYFKTN